MTGFDSKRAAAADKLDNDDLTIAYMSGYHDGKRAAQPAQEPVLWAAKESMFMWGDSDEHGHPYHVITKGKKVQSHQIPLYTTPPQRTWVGLTDEERDDLLDTYITAEGRARAIEQALKEKNT